MKTIIVFVLIMFTATAQAATVKFQVDPLGQEYDVIKIYAANLPRDFDFAGPPAYVGADVIASISGLVAGQTYKFVAVLVRGEETSEPSNIIKQKMPVVTIKIGPPSLTVIEIESE